MWVWIKDWRSRQHSWWCWEPPEAYQLSTDDWEEPGEVSYGFLFFFFLLRYGTQDWPAGAKGEGRIVCVCGCFKGLWDFNRHYVITVNLYNFWINSSFPFHQTLALRAIIRIPWQQAKNPQWQRDPRWEGTCFGNSVLPPLPPQVSSVTNGQLIIFQNNTRVSDIFNGKFYQLCKKEMILLFHNLFQKIEAEGVLSNSFYEASITLILKPDKD